MYFPPRFFFFLFLILTLNFINLENTSLIFVVSSRDYGYFPFSKYVAIYHFSQWLHSAVYEFKYPGLFQCHFPKVSISFLIKKSKPSFSFCYHLTFLLCYVHTFTYASTQTTRIHNVHITNTLTHQHRLLQWLELDIFRFFVFVWWLVNNYTYNNGYRMFSKFYWKGSSFLSAKV